LYPQQHPRHHYHYHSKHQQHWQHHSATTTTPIATFLPRPSPGPLPTMTTTTTTTTTTPIATRKMVESVAATQIVPRQQQHYNQQRPSTPRPKQQHPTSLNI